jgi:hypothetical protein
MGDVRTSIGNSVYGSSQGGWTVADTARPARITTMRNSNNSCKSKIELSTPANLNQQNSSDNYLFVHNSDNITRLQYPTIPQQGLNDISRQEESLSQQNTVFEDLIPASLSHQEELDRLLAGLDRLTETLPDLASRTSAFDNKGYTQNVESGDNPNNSIDILFTKNPHEENEGLFSPQTYEGNNTAYNRIKHTQRTHPQQQHHNQQQQQPPPQQ